MVTIDIDKNPKVAGQLGVRSLPTVVAFIEGQPVDGFSGVVPESQLKELITKLVQKMGGDTVEEAKQIEELCNVAEQVYLAGDDQKAGLLFTDIIQKDPKNIIAIAGLASIKLDKNAVIAAEGYIKNFSSEDKKLPLIQALIARIALIRAVEKEAGKRKKYEKIWIDKNYAAQNNPSDDFFTLNLALAKACYAEKNIEDALDYLLIALKKNKEEKETALLYRCILGATHPKHPKIGIWRRQFSSLLFS